MFRIRHRCPKKTALWPEDNGATELKNLGGFNKIPAEIALHIFSFLTSPQDLANVERTSQQCYELASHSSLWQQADLSAKQKETLNKKLYKAILAKDLKNVRYCCSHGANPNYIVNNFESSTNVNISYSTYQNASLLHIAADRASKLTEKKSLQIVKTLVTHGANLSAKAKYCSTIVPQVGPIHKLETNKTPAEAVQLGPDSCKAWLAIATFETQFKKGQDSQQCVDNLKHGKYNTYVTEYLQNLWKSTNTFQGYTCKFDATELTTIKSSEKAKELHEQFSKVDNNSCVLS